MLNYSNWIICITPLCEIIPCGPGTVRSWCPWKWSSPLLSRLLHIWHSNMHISLFKYRYTFETNLNGSDIILVRTVWRSYQERWRMRTSQCSTRSWLALQKGKSGGVRHTSGEKIQRRHKSEVFNTGYIKFYAMLCYLWSHSKDP